MNRIQLIFLVSILLVLTSACTSEELYRAGQDIQREQCRDGPPSEYDDCMERANENYDSYQAGKEALENRE